MKMRSVAPMKIAKIGYIVVSVLFCIAGILFIALPEISTKIVGIEIGIAAIVFGIVKLIGYFSKDLYRLAFQFDLALGIFTVLIGIVFLLHPQWLISAIPFFVGIFVLVNGLFTFQTSLDSKRFGMKYWWVMNRRVQINENTNSIDSYHNCPYVYYPCTVIPRRRES